MGARKGVKMSCILISMEMTMAWDPGTLLPSLPFQQTN